MRITGLIHEALTHPTDDRATKDVKERVHEVTQAFPTYGDLEL